MSAILKTPMIQTMLAEMSTAQASSMLAMMDTDQVPTDYTIGMASGGIPTTLATNPSFVTISMKQFYVMKTTADTPDTADLRKETKKVTGALYQPTAGTPNYSFIEFGQDICRFWAFINGQALIVPETLSTVELRAEVLKRELEYFSTAISCDADGNVEIRKNLVVDGIFRQKTYEVDMPITVSNLPTGLACYYAHARISNGKLSLVFSFYKTAALSSSNEVQIGSIALSTDVMSKLYPYLSNVLDTKSQVLSRYPASTGTAWITMIVRKWSTTLVFSITNEALNTTGNEGTRFEFNFILS